MSGACVCVCVGAAGAHRPTWCVCANQTVRLGEERRERRKPSEVFLVDRISVLRSG